jgi:TolB-like protein/class 3 adenylate cyclase/TPR repeat protein
MHRKLAAILAADVVGYSALMERDEKGTHERLRACQKELFEPEIARHRGRIFKLMGDGMLAEFGSVVNAVECAVAVQKAMAKRNRAAAAYKRIYLRIGINLGDVIVEGKDRHGEGVNIAARLEQLAQPGGICVSQTVIDHLSNKLPISFEAMGEHHVKNIAKPVVVYRAKLDGARMKRLAPATKSLWSWAAAIAALILLATSAWYALRSPAGTGAAILMDAKPSLAVLPFSSLSDGNEQGYLADGITEDLTTELARVPGLFVISRNATFIYKGKTVQPSQIGKELRVRYVLEGSIRRVGSDMRINAQLIDTKTGGHLWAERFDGQWADVFQLQDRVVANVAGALKLRLVTDGGKAKIAGGTDNPAAYEALLHGLELAHRGTLEDTVKAVKYYEQALSLDPNFGRAQAELAWVYWNSTVPVNEALGLSRGDWKWKLHFHLEAAAKNPSPSYYQILAQQLVRQHRSDEAVATLEKAIALDSSDAGSYADMSQALTFNGRPAEGRGYIDAAMRLDPGWTPWRRYLAGLAYFSMGRFEDAIASLEKIAPGTDGDSTSFFSLILRLSADGHLGRTTNITPVKNRLKSVLTAWGEDELNELLVQDSFVFKNESDIERLLAGLRKAGVPELPAHADSTLKDRLTGAEITALVFGHVLEGRATWPTIGGFKWTITPDGSTNFAIGAQNYKGASWTQVGFLCAAYPMILTSCGPIFHNPGGTFENKNEYVYLLNYARYEFSVVE